MFLDNRIHRGGRRRRRAGKVSREVQEILSDTWNGEVDTDGDSPSESETTDEDLTEDPAVEDTDSTLEVDETQSESWAASSQPSSSSTLSDNCMPSAMPNGACGAPLPGSVQGESTTIPDFASKAAVTESPMTSLASSSTSSVTHNTWITATLDEASSSGVTIVPFITLKKTNSASSAAQPSFTATPSLSSTHIATSASDHYLSTFSTVPSTEAAVPRIVHVDGFNPRDKAGTIVGITVGIAIIIMLIVLSAFAYTRGSAMRGAVSDTHFTDLHSSRRMQSVKHGNESFSRRQETNETPRDLENATSTSDMCYMDENSEWKEIDLREPGRGDMNKDHGQPLESLSQEKKRMLTKRPPELRFNPDLPLPPISWESARSS